MAKAKKKGKAKIKAKKARRPKNKLRNIRVIKGAKKGPASKAEVSGRTSPGAYYWCWNCGATNWVPWGWNYFYCWYDGALNWV